MKKLKFINKNDIEDMDIEDTILYIYECIRSGNKTLLNNFYEHLGKEIYGMERYIDQREKNHTLNELLKARGFRMVTLDSGDFSMHNILGLERKSDDMFSSIWEGKIYQQITELIDTYQYAFLISDKPYSYYLDYLRKRGLEENIWHGFVAGIVDLTGAPPLFVDDLPSMAIVIDYMTRKLWDGKSRRAATLQRVQGNKNEDTVINMLCQLPRCTVKIAKRLLIFAGTLEKAFDFIYIIPHLDNEVRKEIFPGISDNVTDEWINIIDKVWT